MKNACSGCGNELEGGIKFCPKCGKGTEENKAEQIFTASADAHKKQYEKDSGGGNGSYCRNSACVCC